MSPESLPVKLRQARGAMSLAEAADRVGLSEQRIRMYEEGERKPYGKTLRRMAEVYGVPIADLAGPGGLARLDHEQSGGVRRRRRRRRVQGETATPRVEVPLEVGEGQVVRVVIELIIRPKTPVHGVEPTPELPRSLPRASLSEPIEARSAARTDPPAGRAETPPPSGATNGGRAMGEPRGDPLSDIRRAYGEFRRDKR